MKRILPLLLSALFFLPRTAAAQDMATTIRVKAMDMASAFMKNDFATFQNYMHPNVVSYVGGKEKMKAGMDSAYSAMQRFKVSFKRYWIGRPGPIVAYKNQLQSVVPQSTTMRMGLGEVTIESALLAISPDKGKTWWFIDTNVYHGDKIKKIAPDLSPELVIPARSKPKFAPAKD